MPIEIAWSVAVILVLVVILTGAIDGGAGVGFAVVGTMTLATVIGLPPCSAASESREYQEESMFEDVHNREEAIATSEQPPSVIK